MDKRALRKIIPSPQKTNEFRNKAIDVGARYVVKTQKVIVDEQETIILNIFQVSGKNKKDVSLSFRVCLQKDDYSTLDTTSNKWRVGALLHIICSDSGYSEYWWNYSALVFATKTDEARCRNTIKRWVGKNSNIEDTAFGYLDYYQEQIKAKKLAKKHKVITDKIDAEMEKFGELPEDYQEFVEKTVFAGENYLFYDKSRAYCYCSSCGKEFEIRDNYLWHKKIPMWNTRDIVKHGTYGLCPYCQKSEQFYGIGYGREKLTAVEWSVLVQKKDDEVLVRYFCHEKSWRKSYKEPEYRSSEQMRAVHTREQSTDYEWNRFKNTNTIRWVYWREKYYSYWSPSEYVLPRSIHVYNENLNESVKGTCMEYSCVSEFLNYVRESTDKKSAYIIDQYFNAYRKKPWLEQVIKCGFINIASEVFFNSHHHNDDFENAKDICGIFGINKGQLRLLRESENPRIKDIEILKYFGEKLHREPTKDEFQTLRYIQDDGWVDSYKHWIDAIEYTTIHKLKKYFTEQKIKHKKDFFDFIDWLREMGYNLRNQSNIYPKNFAEAHDMRSKEYMRFKNKKEIEAVKKFNKLLKQMRKEAVDVDALNLKMQGLFIRLPFKLSELTVEGEKLHHCVGTYKGKVAKGETTIFFIRKIEDPDTPYYTLEWKQGRIVQCRGLKNCDMTPEVKAFTELFAKKYREYENKIQNNGRKAG